MPEDGGRMIDQGRLFSHLVDGTRDFLGAVGTGRAVVGVSGGVDSATVFAICREAIGAENVTGVVMPSKFSSHETQRDALALIETGGTDCRVIPVKPALEAFQTMNPLTGIAYENLQSRIRMVILMGIANQENRLLLSTGNRSEDMVGYFTLYGDSAGAICPIGDLYKTEVYQLAEWISENVLAIPGGILTRPPSAELSEGQKDIDLLPDYPTLDRILRFIIDGEGEPHPDRDLVRKVEKLVEDSAFKREQMCSVIPARDLISAAGEPIPLA